MENEIIRLLLGEIKDEKELRKRLLRKLELLDAYSRCRYGVGVRGGIIMEEKKIVNVTERPNSYEFGKAGNRFKIYFEDRQDGEKAIDACKDLAEYKDKKFGGADDGE